MNRSGVPVGALWRAADAAHLPALVRENSPLRPTLAELGRAYLRPPRLQVVGRPGVGRTTMTQALRDRLSLDVLAAPVPSGGWDSSSDSAVDLWIFVLAGLPRQADIDLIARLPRDRVVVVLGKADTHGDRDTAASVAELAAHQLGRPVSPVSGLLACAEVGDDEFAALQSWADAGVEMPSMAGQFLSGPSDSADRAMRLRLLRTLDQFGIDLALTFIGSGPPGTQNAASLTRALHAVSGISDLRASLAAASEPIRQWRYAELRMGIELAAITGCDRDAAEALLADEPVTGARR